MSNYLIGWLWGLQRKYTENTLCQYLAEKTYSEGRNAGRSSDGSGGKLGTTVIAETGLSQHRKYEGYLSICPHTIKKKYKSDFFFYFLNLLLSIHSLLQWAARHALRSPHHRQISFNSPFLSPTSPHSHIFPSLTPNEFRFFNNPGIQSFPSLSDALLAPYNLLAMVLLSIYS